MYNPNIIAYLALLIWPIIVIILFKKFSPLQASLWALIGGYLILPVRAEFDLPLVPSLNKDTLPAISAFIGCIYISKKPFSFIPQFTIEKWLISIIFIWPLIIVTNNMEMVMGIAGLTYYDAISSIISMVFMFIPFLIGLGLVKTYNDQVSLFKWLAISGIFYSIPALLEVRLSPQLHTWIYGFFPHTFGQQIRDGGYRPVVFIGHGLLLATYYAICFMSAILLKLNNIQITKYFSPSANIIVVLYMALMLIICKSLGPILLSVIFLIPFCFKSIRIAKCLAFSLVLTSLSYPMLAILDLLPYEKALELTSSLSADRAQSLSFRFFHEGQLLSHAYEKLITGWGFWGRNRLPNSVSDGYWIIIIGMYGLVGFICIFGLLCLPVLRAIQVSKYINSENENRLLIGNALLVALLVINQIPNNSTSLGSNMFWLLIGALLGRTNHILHQRKISKKIDLNGSRVC